MNYASSAVWGNETHVSPSTGTLQLLSSFIVGDGLNKDVGIYYLDRGDIPINQKWLIPWDVDQPIDVIIPVKALAGVIARIVAIVTQKLGNSLNKKEIIPRKVTPAALLSVDWKWVWLVLGLMTGVQLVVIVVAMILAVGSLDLGDNLELIGLFASRRFPDRNEPERIIDKPWTKRVATSRSNGSREALT